jgi:hypothetical protein
MNNTLNALYNSEINVEITSFWDDGWTIKIGDAMNGYKTEINTPSLDENTASWLTRTVCDLYPNSVFAKEAFRR